MWSLGSSDGRAGVLSGDGWRLADPQLAGGAAEAYRIGFDPMDVPRDAFLVGGRAWQECRRGERDPERFGVSVVGGPVGTVRDLLAAEDGLRPPAGLTVVRTPTGRARR
ncbi:hypothetical protein E1091_12115 [Micromonospora fluostatini]|uniref:Uncharacterized protein n=1 Tax=Micromonospora fluostatini TaxID=1629071 RepID=A0ABY2DFX0_9ACTN|nr:hypothetical protein E1091_12115 [Micromonospora fluostatini]